MICRPEVGRVAMNEGTSQIKYGSTTQRQWRWLQCCNRFCSGALAARPLVRIIWGRAQLRAFSHGSILVGNLESFHRLHPVFLLRRCLDGALGDTNSNRKRTPFGFFANLALNPRFTVRLGLWGVTWHSFSDCDVLNWSTAFIVRRASLTSEIYA